MRNYFTAMLTDISRRILVLLHLDAILIIIIMQITKVLERVKQIIYKHWTEKVRESNLGTLFTLFKEIPVSTQFLPLKYCLIISHDSFETP